MDCHGSRRRAGDDQGISHPGLHVPVTIFIRYLYHVSRLTGISSSGYALPPRCYCVPFRKEMNQPPIMRA